MSTILIKALPKCYCTIIYLEIVKVRVTSAAGTLEEMMMTRGLDEVILPPICTGFGYEWRVGLMAVGRKLKLKKKFNR